MVPGQRMGLVTPCVDISVSVLGDISVSVLGDILCLFLDLDLVLDLVLHPLGRPRWLVLTNADLLAVPRIGLKRPLFFPSSFLLLVRFPGRTNENISGSGNSSNCFSLLSCLKEVSAPP